MPIPLPLIRPFLAINSTIQLDLTGLCRYCLFSISPYQLGNGRSATLQLVNSTLTRLKCQHH